MALQYTSQLTSLPAPDAVDQTAFSTPPHTFMSFLDRSSGPLAWRAGLPPAALSGVLDLSAKTTGNLHTTHRGHVHPADSAERIRYDMNDFVKSTAWANHDMLQLRPSVLGEPQQQQQCALSVKASCDDGANSPCRLPVWLDATSGELLHVHADGSSHMVLSLADATLAVERGWAVSEAAGSLPLGYVAVHAPRNAAELIAWKRLALASVRYATYPWTGMEIRRPERL